MDFRQDNRSITEIAYKRLQGTASDEEIEIYERWYASFKDEELELGEGDVDATSQLGAGLYSKLMLKVSKEQPKKTSYIIHLKWFAAAAVLVLGMAYWLYQSNALNKLLNNQSARQVQIVPGKAKATLKLANGRSILLQENEDGLVIDSKSLKYTDGTGIVIPENQLLNRQEMILSTPKGGTYQVVLPDGSKVWLNALSSIKLPADFASAFERHVELSGEAYFEVAKSKIRYQGSQKRRPFLVSVGNRTVEVLGTHFNIKSYAEEKGVKTTLLEGSVRVGTGNKYKVISPGQQALVTNDNISTSTVDVEEAVAWKNGNFQFADEDIQHVMLDIARWYNVEVVYQGAVTKERFGGTISRNKPITEVLASLEETGAVHFKIEGRSVIVMR
ncbi:FecR family protein [Pedobacter vanadiisoli]|uniref:FecR family protein n=1 Tax=Pedobacter vanadiisoli TaxID=1761975 RepID=A0ABW5MIV6_9SPHI